MSVVSAAFFTATLPAPGGVVSGVGARIEVPVTRAIVSAWVAATLDVDTWSVNIQAPAALGSYELVWTTSFPTDPFPFPIFVPLDVVSDTSPSLVFPLIDTEQITPSIDDVAKLERTRTTDENGNDLGTFTDVTFPTADDVQDVIDDAVDLVLNQLPDALDTSLYPKVKTAIKLQAALLIETSYFRVDGSGTGQGATAPAATYRALLTQTMNALSTLSAEPGLGMALV